jgi:hypothetical protein
MPIISATWKADIKRITVQGQQRQGVHETSSQPTPAKTRSLKLEDGVPGWLRQKQYPISKITTAKRAGGVAQVVQASITLEA